MLHLDLNRILKEYTRGQLTLLSDASKILYEKSSGEPEKPGESPAPSKRTPVEQWLDKVDTRKMTLKEYKKFLALQQGQGE